MSDYNKNHEYCSIANKKVIGKLKDELNDITLEEFCSLQLNMYMYKFPAKDAIKGKSVKCKGIKKSVVNDDSRQL